MSMSHEERTAARGGPTSDDPATRAEAARLAKFELGQTESDRPTLVVLTVGCAIAAIALGPWLRLSATCFATILALVVVRRRQAEQRWQRLRVVDPAA